MEKLLLSWSGGKDSALCLFELSLAKQFQVAALLTTLTEGYERVSMHGVRKELLMRQSRSLGIPLDEVWIPQNATNETYQQRMSEAITKWKGRGVSTVAFGDLFLRDIREYRENFLQVLGMKSIFPLWGRNTEDLAKFFIQFGFKAKLCCVDPKFLREEFCGREFDQTFLTDIPKKVDPCGENGEFHTFVYVGPIFEEKIKVKVGDIVTRGGFCFADVLPID